MINKEKIKNALEIYSYGDACGFALALIAVIVLIIFSFLNPIVCAIFMSFLIMVAAVCSLGYIIYRLLN